MDFYMPPSLSPFKKWTLVILSLVIVAFGQPAWNWGIGLLSACVGFALFWRVLLEIPQTKTRFWLAAGWFMTVQLLQLSWLISHPFLYIYAALFFIAGMTGLQFGLLSIWIRPSSFNSIWRLLAIAAAWTLLEWSRLFFLSGFSFNPVGLALTGAIYPLQFASVGGLYLLSFWVVLVNLLVLRAYLLFWQPQPLAVCAAVCLVPYLFGVIHFHWHEKEMQKDPSTFSAVLVQTAFPIEESMGFQTAEEARLFVMSEWAQIFSIAKQHLHQSVDLVVLPEYIVPYGTYYSIFPLQTVKTLLKDILGETYLEALPPIKEPYASFVETDQGKRWLVNNAFFAQTLANLFQAGVVVGLEDVEYTEEPLYEKYSSAVFFPPNNGVAQRYEKRVLVPLGEYIPFEWCKQFAASYGITGSFTCGKEAKVFSSKIPLGPSICYEETYGNLMRESRAQGAELLVNLTSDVWFPDSRLPQQHFDHARLRTIENGVPLVRACNTGVTGAVDSLGRNVRVLGEDSFKDQWLSDALFVEVPKYHYRTLYTWLGDSLILSCSLFFIGAFFYIERKNRKF